MAALQRFRRALRREDQLALDEILVHVHHHMMATSYEDHLLSFETFLLAMLLEDHKENKRLEQRIEVLERVNGIRLPSNPLLPPNPMGF
jgi:hypothetical protein